MAATQQPLYDMATTPECLHNMAATPESSAFMVARCSGRHEHCTCGYQGSP
ncbi:hypothetical protein DPX16_11896 [Anabarilius grahami]|uniref:Uncharacterized protein n=1 Tax=Anabarilius grahami TaxID=495550 RepID=A0A3N0YCN6_ANAGA|nr:hypothetical protein DPX16_11896 [Anabarilius grahami]